jgi:hypothetical protein
LRAVLDAAQLSIACRSKGGQSCETYDETLNARSDDGLLPLLLGAVSCFKAAVKLRSSCLACN